jgi:arylsulfatase
LPYNQVSSIWNAQGDAVNAAPGVARGVRPEDPYAVDEHGLRPDGFVLAMEGKKGEQAREFGEPSDPETYGKIDAESEKRLLDFVRRNAADNKPFFASYFPNLTSFIPSPQKATYNSGMLADGLKRLDAYIGELMAELEKLGIAENTVLVCMADNGPMIHNPPGLLGMSETIFRGGKGDFTEGGVRVPAFAWWPGAIKPGQIVNDIVHETDLFTTFARLGGATEHIPTDRVIDGIDQTALLLNGDTRGRRDYVFIYTGDTLGATVKGRYKRHWQTEGGVDTGTTAAFYDLVLDPREQFPQLVPLIWQSGQWDRMLARHELWKEKYPNRPKARGIPFTGIENARPETKAIGERFERLREQLPFDPLEFLQFSMPESMKVTQRVDAVD